MRHAFPFAVSTLLVFLVPASAQESQTPTALPRVDPPFDTSLAASHQPLSPADIRFHEPGAPYISSQERLAGWGYYRYDEDEDEEGDGNADLKRIEELLEEQAEEIDALKSALKLKVDPGHNKATMKVVGRVHVDYWAFPESDAGTDAIEGGPAGPQDRLNFRRMRFGVRGSLPSNMEYRIEMEFAGGNASEFRDAWLGWNDLPYLHKLLIGNQKRPYGLDHLNSSRYNVFIERPFVVESFNQDARRLGVQSWGVSDDEGWNWRYGVFNQRLIQDEGNYTNDHLQLEFAGRLANTFWYDECSGGRGYGHWAVSATTAYPDGSTPMDNDSQGPDVNEARFRHRPEARTATRWLDTGVIDGADNYQLLGVESVLNFGPLQFVGEYENVWLERDPGFGGDLHFHGGYLYLSYFLTGEHMSWNRRNGTLGRIRPFEDFFMVRTCDGRVGKGWGAWQVAGRWSYADFNDVDIAGGKGESFTLGVNWYWTAYARMQFNWIHGEIRENGVTRAPSVLSGDYDIVGARFMVDF